jgi:hypothetical protein
MCTQANHRRYLHTEKRERREIQGPAKEEGKEALLNTTLMATATAVLSAAAAVAVVAVAVAVAATYRMILT